MVRACCLVLLATFGIASADEPRTRAAAIAQFDELTWAGGGRGAAGRVRALRAGGHKPTKKRPRIDVDLGPDAVVVVEHHDVIPRPCPPCPCTKDRMKCAPCVKCRRMTRVVFAARWSRVDGQWTQQGPRAADGK